MKWIAVGIILGAILAGSCTEAAYFGNDVFVGNLYGNEVITIPRQTARKLSDNMMRRSVMMTNSVLSFLSKCNVEELAHLTNGTFLVSAFYHQFDLDGVGGWALSMSLFKAESAEQRLVQFAILPNGTIVKSRLPRQGEVYVIRNKPIEIDQKDFEGIIREPVMMTKLSAGTAFVRAGDRKGLSDSDAVVVIPYEQTYDQCQAWLLCLLISLAITVISIVAAKLTRGFFRNRKKESHG